MGTLDGSCEDGCQVAGDHEVEPGRGQHLLPSSRLLVSLDRADHAMHQARDNREADDESAGRGEGRRIGQTLAHGHSRKERRPDQDTVHGTICGSEEDGRCQDSDDFVAPAHVDGDGKHADRGDDGQVGGNVDIAAPVHVEPGKREGGRCGDACHVEKHQAGAGSHSDDQRPDQVGHGESQEQQLHPAQQVAGPDARTKTLQDPRHLQPIQDDHFLRSVTQEAYGKWVDRNRLRLMTASVDGASD